MGRDRTAPAEPKPLRLFLAVDVSEGAKDAIETVLGPRRTRLPARWTGRSGWHITLKFLGRTWPRLVPEVEAASAAVAAGAEPFSTSLGAVGAFPSTRRARVLWVGLNDPEGRFGAMASALDEALGDFFVPERRPFTPHLTVARLQPPRDVGEFDRDLVGLEVGSEVFGVDRLVLYRSHLSPAGARYEPMATWPLGR